MYGCGGDGWDVGRSLVYYMGYVKCMERWLEKKGKGV